MAICQSSTNGSRGDKQALHRTCRNSSCAWSVSPTSDSQNTGYKGTKLLKTWPRKIEIKSTYITYLPLHISGNGPQAVTIQDYLRNHKRVKHLCKMGIGPSQVPSVTQDNIKQHTKMLRAGFVPATHVSISSKTVCA